MLVEPGTLFMGSVTYRRQPYRIEVSVFLNIFDSISHKFFCWNFPHYLSCLNFFCFLALSSPIPLFEGLCRNLFRYHNKTLVIDNLCPFFLVQYMRAVVIFFYGVLFNVIHSAALKQEILFPNISSQQVSSMNLLSVLKKLLLT